MSHLLRLGFIQHVFFMKNWYLDIVKNVDQFLLDEYNILSELCAFSGLWTYMDVRLVWSSEEYIE